MKNGSNKKLVLLVCMLKFLLLTGYGFWEKIPNLINANKPFIDLAGSVGESIGNANAAYEKATTITQSPDPEVTVTPMPSNSLSEIENRLEKAEEIRIVIGAEYLSGPGESILVNENDIGDVANFGTLFRSSVFEGKTIILFDNYAETKTYREVKRILSESGKEFREEAAGLSGAEFINGSLR